jgi:hypothetical protein
VDWQEAALVIVGVEHRQLLMAMALGGITTVLPAAISGSMTRS